MKKQLDAMLEDDFDVLRHRLRDQSRLCADLRTGRSRMMMISASLVGMFPIAYVSIQKIWEAYPIPFGMVPLAFAIGVISVVASVVQTFRSNRRIRIEDRLLSQLLELIRETGSALAYTGQISATKWAETKIELSKYGI